MTNEQVLDKLDELRHKHLITYHSDFYLDVKRIICNCKDIEYGFHQWTLPNFIWLVREHGTCLILEETWNDTDYDWLESQLRAFDFKAAYIYHNNQEFVFENNINNHFMAKLDKNYKNYITQLQNFDF